MFYIEKNVLLTIKGKFLKVLKIAFGHPNGQKMLIFSLFGFAQDKTRNKVYFLAIKTKFLKFPKDAFFQRG